MRILNLSYKNINSLAGEGHIDFDQGPIAASGVFAITGPNGSGKTSILDVITLALYGETFRFSKPAEHVITQHTDDGYARVEFSIGGQRYRAIWQAQRGQALPEMTLSQQSLEAWEVLADTPTAVRHSLAEISGMDFHRFSKSMVLPQGDFAAFLNALDSERMDILEKISGSELYDHYRQQIEGRLPAVNAQIGQLEQEMALLPLLDPGELEAASADLADFEEQAQTLKIDLENWQSQQADFTHLKQLRAQHAQIFAQQHDLQLQLATLELQYQQLQNAPDTQGLEAELAIVQSREAELANLQIQLNQIRSELAQLQQQLPDSHHLPRPGQSHISLLEQKQTIDGLKQQIAELKQAVPQQANLMQAIQQELSDKQQTHAQLSALDSTAGDALLLQELPDVIQLRNLRRGIAELHKQLKTQQKQHKSDHQAVKKNQHSHKATQARIETLQKLINEQQQQLNLLAPGKSLEDLQQLQVDQRERVNQTRELLNIAEINQRLTHKAWYDWFTPKPKVVSDDELELQQKISELEQDISREENIGKVLERAMANENLLRKMANERKKLVDGQPCHLCGSLDHPYAHKVPSFNDAKLALVDQRSKIGDLKSRRQQLQNQLKALQKQNSQSEAKQRFLVQKRADWSLLANRLNVMDEKLDINHISRLKQLLSDENDDLSRINNLIRDYSDILRSIAKAETELTAKQQLLQSLQQEGQALLPSGDGTAVASLSPIQQHIQQLTGELNALIAKLSPQLEAVGEKLPGKGKEDVLFERLNSRRQDLQIRALRQQGLLEDINRLQQQLQPTQYALLDLQQQLNDALESLQSAEALGLHLTILEKQQWLIQQEQQFKLQQSELEAMWTLVNSHIRAQGFDSPAQLQSLIGLRAHSTAINDHYQNAQQQLQSLLLQLAGLDQQIDTAAARLDPDLSDETVQARIQQLAQQLDICQHEIDTLTHKLQKQAQYREKYQQLENERVQYYRQLTQIQDELTQIDNTPGGLRRHIQQLLINTLLSEANRILEKINGRYYVRAADSAHGLALEIEDTRHHNQRRLPKTLSGGESFVVSLALALALAEIANNGRSIESLFLDEGFGNLDAESLYLAMGALEGLSIQGKTVGVISHVEGVKKRIKTQLELVKKADGCSELKWVA